MTEKSDNLVTKAELARMARRSKASVSNAVKRTDLALAMVGGKINARHPAAIDFVQRGVEQHKKNNPHEYPDDYDPYAPTDEQIQETISKLPQDIRDLLDLSLRQIIKMFGTDKSMTEFLRAVKDIEAIHKMRLDTAEKEGKLVSRRLVDLVFDMFDTMFKRLLSDGARTIAHKNYTMAMAGQSEQDLETFVNARLSKFIKATKTKAAKALRAPTVGE